jgi:hypothetical protein
MDALLSIVDTAAFRATVTALCEPEAEDAASIGFRVQAARAELAELRVERDEQRRLHAEAIGRLCEWEDDVRKVMAEDCAPGERHCACVPILRRELRKLAPFMVSCEAHPNGTAAKMAELRAAATERDHLLSSLLDKLGLPPVEPWNHVSATTDVLGGIASLSETIGRCHDALGESRASDDESIPEGIREWVDAAKSADAEAERLRQRCADLEMILRVALNTNDFVATKPQGWMIWPRESAEPIDFADDGTGLPLLTDEAREALRGAR